MIFYFLFLFFIALLCGRYNIMQGKYLVGKKTGYRIAIWFIILVSAMRFNVGYDWSSYLSYIYPVYNPLYFKRLEPFNRLICSLAGILQQPWILFSIYAIITYTLIGKTISDFSCAKYESLMVYICLYYLPGLSTIRQEIAVAIIFFGYRYIREKKIFKYCIICVFAMCFHKTAIIALIFYPLYYLKLSITILFLSLFGIFFKFLLPKLVGALLPMFLLYLERGGIGSSSGNFQKFFYLLLFVYSLLLHNKKGSCVGLLNICSIGCMLPFILGGHTGGRLGEYFLIYYSLLIPECNKRLKIEYRVLFLFPLYAFFFMYLFVSVNINHSNEYVPFRWYPLESLEQELQ